MYFNENYCDLYYNANDTNSLYNNTKLGIGIIFFYIGQAWIFHTSLCICLYKWLEKLKTVLAMELC